jgi:adenylate kinase family enzyme
MVDDVRPNDTSPQLARLVEAIDHALIDTEPAVVAISGFGGSGKSTLADRVAAVFEIDRGLVLRTDSLYSTTPHSRGLFDITDWTLLSRLLLDARHSERLSYVGRTYFGDPVVVDDDMPRVVIVEGLRLYRPEVMSAFDVAVWIDCPLERATQRAKARNRLQDESDYELGLWDSLWAPLDAEYFSSDQPDRLATLLYRADKLDGPAQG